MDFPPRELRTTWPLRVSKTEKCQRNINRANEFHQNWLDSPLHRNCCPKSTATLHTHWTLYRWCFYDPSSFASLLGAELNQEFSSACLLRKNWLCPKSLRWAFWCAVIELCAAILISFYINGIVWHKIGPGISISLCHQSRNSLTRVCRLKGRFACNLEDCLDAFTDYDIPGFFFLRSIIGQGNREVGC